MDGNIISLEEFFHAHNKIALGFSGGVDSSYLLYAGLKYGADIKPYFVKGAFQPEFEKKDAVTLAGKLGVEVEIIRADVLSNAKVMSNDKLRCYYCKQGNFSLIAEKARADGYDTIIDGTNASDDISDRPGFKALQEMQVLSPLRMAGLTKEKIRELSREAGLFTWNKPSYACLATRITTGTAITAEVLQRIEAGEAAMFNLGYNDFRLRVLGNMAKLQLKSEQMVKAVQEREEIRFALRPYFTDIVLDLKER